MDWESIGYADGLRACLKVEATSNYPRQDKHGPADEAKYLTGYRTAQVDFATSGLDTMRHYLSEKTHA